MKNKIKKMYCRILNVFRQFRVSSSFIQKLSHNYHELTFSEKILYFFLKRKKFSSSDRFFFEGEVGLHGQMYIADREGLYDAILAFQPRFCIEIGTYTGGGSTYFLGKAFEKIGKGKLYTLESDPYLHKLAKTYYETKLSKTANYIDFLHGNNVGAFQKVIETYDNKVDCVFLDGAEDSKETLEQYNFFKPYLKSGSVLMAHDWNTEKTASLKPVLLGDEEWKLINYIEPPSSVGFVVFKRQ